LFYSQNKFNWQKQQNRALCHPLEDLRGNVHGSSIGYTRWKARCRLPITISDN